MSNLVGSYVKPTAEAVVAALASRNHIGLISKPGTGKTTIANDVLQRIFGDDYVMSRFNPTSGPELVEGRFDMDKWLTKNEIGYITDGTPYQTGCKVWLADEAVRANMAILDLFVKVLDEWGEGRKTGGGTQTSGPIVVMTANFLPKGERTEAFLDRLGMMVWVQPEEIDAIEFARAQALARTQGIHVGIDLPTRDEIERVWIAQPTERAIVCTAEAIKLITEVAQKGLTDENGVVKTVFSDINNRRKAQWLNLLVGTSILYSGTEDYDTVHPKALEAMQYAWNSRTIEEARDWAELIGTIADPVTAMVDAALRNAYDVFQQIAASGGKDAISRLGVQIAKASDDIRRFVPESDPRYSAAIDQLNDTFSRIYGELSRRS